MKALAGGVLVVLGATVIGVLSATADEPSQPRRNVALAANGSTVRASSEGTYLGITEYAARAIDGTRSTSWSNSSHVPTTGRPAWLEVSFNGTYLIDTVGVWWASHGQAFSIQLSRDGTTWTTAVPTRASTNAEGHSPSRPEMFDIAPREATHIRVLITATTAPSSHIFQASIAELFALGKPATPSVPTGENNAPRSNPNRGAEPPRTAAPDEHVPSTGTRGGFYDGTWDSTLYNLAQHPRTIALRVVVDDARSGQQLSGVTVRILGDERPHVALEATTGRDGVAVFGLGWQKTSRYEAGLDDIETVRRIVASHPEYGSSTFDLDLARLEEDPDQGWKDLVRRWSGAKYYLGFFGPRFDEFNQRRCRAQVFFEKVRIGDYDRSFRAREDTERDFPRHFVTSNPQVEAGPFIVLPVRLRLGSRGDASPGRPTPRGAATDDGGAPRPGSPGSGDRGGLDQDEVPSGYLTAKTMSKIRSLVTESMTPREIIETLGAPLRMWTSSEGNRCYYWQSFENSRSSVTVITKPNSNEILRIEFE